MTDKNYDEEVKTIVALAKPAYDHIEPLAKSLNSVFKEEPHLKTALTLLKAPSSISDAIFMHKFDVFYQTGKLSEANIKKLNKKLTGNKKSRFWKLIFTSIQSHDDEKRSALVGKVVVALTAGNITYEEAVRMIHASNSINVDNLDYLLNSYLGNPGSMPGYARQEFVTVGLLGMTQNPSGGWNQMGGVNYPLVDFGARYVGAIYDYPIYPQTKIRVGKDRLVNAGKDTSDSFRKEIPITLAIDKGYWYGEASLILRDKNKILVVKQDPISPIVASSPIYAGEYGERALSNITDIKEEHFKPVYIYNDTKRHKSIHVYSLENQLASPALRPSGSSWTEYEQLKGKKYAGFLDGLSNALSKYDEAELQKKPRDPYDF